MLYKRDKIWWYQLKIKGRRYRATTGLTNKEDARTFENGIRTEIRLGNIGILKAGPAPLLKEFLKDDFDPFVLIKHRGKPNTLDYYKFGSRKLKESKIGRRPLDEICEADTAAFQAEHSHLSPSGMNQSLRTLRRAMNLAYQWRKLSRPAKIALASGERQRERVLARDEDDKYLPVCREPWRTMATIILNIALRPGEVFQLKVTDLDWENFQVKVRSGKSKAAKRELPMVDEVYAAIKTWMDSIGWPESGWLFPSPDIGRKGKPYSQNRVFDWHHEALEKSGLEDFDPYSLRHTALTRIAEHCKNPYALAKLAGHSSITMTYRYIHPQEAEIKSVLELASGNKIGNAARREKLKVVGLAEEPQGGHNMATVPNADLISNKS